jgi:NADH-quinone oxidoreductase subunit H
MPILSPLPPRSLRPLRFKFFKRRERRGRGDRKRVVRILFERLGKPRKVFRGVIFFSLSLPISFPAIETVFKIVQRALVTNSARGSAMEELLDYYLLLIIALVAAILLITFMLVSAIFSVWLERKVAGFIQDRLGPTRVGGKWGWLQTLADGIKLLCKEDIVPATADKTLFRMGPYIVLVASFLAFLALPFGHHFVAQNMNVAVFFILAVLSLEVYGVILIGYGSGSKWSMFGGMREAAQMVSYEIPMAISILVPVIAAGTMNLHGVMTGVTSESNPVYGHGNQYGLVNWLVFRDPFTFCAFWLYFTCATASCKRAPFDLAEAESELVAGFHTEYSGFRWLTIFMAEYGSMVVVSGIACYMFLGGWSIGLPWELTVVLGPVVGTLLNVLLFIAKCWFLVFIMMWVRWTLPRLRIDQVMMTCLKYILPISCALLLGVTVWRLMAPGIVQTYFKWVLFGLSLFALVMLIRQWIVFQSKPPSTAMPGMWRAYGLTGYQGEKRPK